MTQQQTTYNTDEVNKFSEYAAQWWDPEGSAKPLHSYNPLRVGYIEKHLGKPLKGLKILDIGCGGGLLCEALASLGATMTGLDASEKAIEVATNHAKESNLTIEYVNGTIEDFKPKSKFDVITCMEVIEHVDSRDLFAESIAKHVKKDGHLFLSTINRTPLSFAGAIVAAEYVMGLLPRGTHSYEKFMKPSEVDVLFKPHGFDIQDVQGVAFNPMGSTMSFTGSTAINYLAHWVKG